MNGQSGYNNFGLDNELFAYHMGDEQTDMMMGSLAGAGTTDPIRSSTLYNLPTSMAQPISSSSTLPGTVASPNGIPTSQSPYTGNHYGLPQQQQPPQSRSQSLQQHPSQTNLQSLNASLSPPNRNASTNDMIGTYGDSTSGFNSSVSPMTGDGNGYDIGYDDSFAYDDMGGVMIGDDSLGDGFDPLSEVFNDPLNEGIVDPLHDLSYQDGYMEDQSPTPNKSSDHAEKRKSFEGAGERDSTEPGENEPKKRGRKRITSEPSSKRKAQNRAAQRAFRERKEKHVRDLEIKVSELEKASESANNENSVLRAKVDQLQTELKTYRKRLYSVSRAQKLITGGGPTGGFEFDFPHEWNKIGQQQPERNGNSNGNTSGNSNANSNGNGQFSEKQTLVNGTAHSENSPSVSSNSVRGQTDTSCATSPEPTVVSPKTPPASHLGNHTDKDITIGPNGEAYACGSMDDGETSFCEKLGMLACGLPSNPLEKVPDLDHIRRLKQKALEDMRAKAKSSSASSTPAPSGIGSPEPTNHEIPTISKLSEENHGQFNPAFGEYRDPVEKLSEKVSKSDPGDAVFGLDPQWGFGENKKHAVAGLLDDDSDDESAWNVQQGRQEKMMTCNKIWDRISHHPSFKSGGLDMDDLCSELRQKAKCSESGVVIGERQLEKVLRKVEAEAASRHSSPKALA